MGLQPPRDLGDALDRDLVGTVEHRDQASQPGVHRLGTSRARRTEAGSEQQVVRLEMQHVAHPQQCADPRRHGAALEATVDLDADPDSLGDLRLMQGTRCTNPVRNRSRGDCGWQVSPQVSSEMLG